MLVFVAAASGRSGDRTAQPTTLARVSGSVDALAQDGRRIAWIKTRASCGRQVQVLTLPGGRPVHVGPGRGGSCGRRPIRAIALDSAGRVFWQQVTDEGNTYLTIGLFTAALGSPTRPVAGSYFDKRESDPDYVDPVPLPMAADAKAMLFYASCDASELCAGNRRQPGIYRLAGRRPFRLANVTSPVGLAVSGRRFAVATQSLRCCNSTPAWSHDGRRVAWIYHGNLWTVRAEGTDDRQLAAGVSPPRSSLDDARRPSWSPDGSRLVFEDAQGQRGVYRVDATGAGLRHLASGTAPAWSPDGTRIAFVRGTGVYSIAPDGGGERKLTAAARATAGPLSWSPDSTRIAVSRGGDIYAVRADGAGETRLTTSGGPEAHPAWSPDGARIAYLDGSTIAVVNANGTGATRLTGGADRSPTWSPDSKRIAFVRVGADVQGTVWVMNADGRDQRPLIPAASPQWSPGGGTILVGDWYDPDGVFPSDPGIRVVSPVDGTTRKIAPMRRSPVEIRDAVTGRLIRRFTIDGHANAIALGRDYVALLVGHDPGARVELYNLDGRLRTAAAVPSSVRNVAAAGGTVVFATGRLIRRLDARTGAVTVLATARRTPVGLTIEGRRVVWAENSGGAARIRAVTLP